MSGGEQLRDYLDVTEAASHLAQLALGQRGHGLVNLCSGRPISVRRLVEGWIKTNRWSIRPDLGRYPDPTHEPLAFWGDATKLSHCLQSL
jgi:dTDP-6-deoxy-L-talose 4-dehydrogenase (NAD+)